MGRRFSARVENGAHQHGEVWQEGGGCGVAAAENTMLGTRFLRVLRAFAVKVQPRIHREAAKSAKISRRKTLRPAKNFRVSSIDNTDLCSMVMQRVLANPPPNDH